MENISIIADSGCDLMPKELGRRNVSFTKVPCKITIDGIDYSDDDKLNVPVMIKRMEISKKAGKTACPSPGEWMEAFEECSGGPVIAITISHGVSGSFSSAAAARDMFLDDYPDRKIFVFDSYSCGPAESWYVLETAQMISSGMKYEDIISELESMRMHSRTEFAFCNFDNLIKAGRMNRIAGLVATKLHIWGVGASVDNSLKLLKKTRGETNMVLTILQNLDSRGFSGGLMVIEHCDNRSLADKIAQLVMEKWPGADIRIVPTRGLCSYYAERGGIIIHCAGTSVTEPN
ncbi:MAG: DegV family protein [Oscillospiraceae bacterium]